MADLDPDRTLALSYVSARHRPALEALWGLDVALGAVLAGGRDPMLSRIKLVWWRDALEALDVKPVPAEPVLQAIAAAVLPLGVTGAELSAMEEGWEVLLSGDPLTPEDLDTYAAARGAMLFRFAARLLGGPERLAGAAGEAWALADLARHSNEADADAAIARLRTIPPTARLPGRLRPLGMLGALGHRDAEPNRPRWEQQGAPGRMWRMLRHRLTGL
ncbi:MAG TPA: squalene/phytoene synthase family protein [Allosphingosinicella sp.]|nr:squalene/phytoene synthase family protein [Allosphingosinicella sp.]